MWFSIFALVHYTIHPVKLLNGFLIHRVHSFHFFVPQFVLSELVEFVFNSLIIGNEHLIDEEIKGSLHSDFSITIIVLTSLI